MLKMGKLGDEEKFALLQFKSILACARIYFCAENLHSKLFHKTWWNSVGSLKNCPWFSLKMHVFECKSTISSAWRMEKRSPEMIFTPSYSCKIWETKRNWEKIISFALLFQALLKNWRGCRPLASIFKQIASSRVRIDLATRCCPVKKGASARFSPKPQIASCLKNSMLSGWGLDGKPSSNLVFFASFFAGV